MASRLSQASVHSPPGRRPLLRPLRCPYLPRLLTWHPSPFPFPGPRTCKELLTRGTFSAAGTPIYLPTTAGP